jgi:ParB/RepB/Spo0J family partition protein
MSAAIASPRVSETVVRDIPLVQITADPGQPRKVFERNALRELAASIKADGLLQPITLRQIGPDAYMIVAGERRFRASELNNASTIRAIVIQTTDIADIRVKQIIENDQRVDVTALEQARSYQALMDEKGWTAEQLGERIGKSVNRITDRTILLALRPEYQELLAGGNLKITEAWELVRLTPRGQSALFNLIRAGKCLTTADLRNASNALLAAEAQTSIFGDDPEAATEETRKLAGSFEANVERIAALLRSGINENQIVATKKTNPHRAGYLADLLAAMQKDMRRIEVALREAAVQASLFGGA